MWNKLTEGDGNGYPSLETFRADMNLIYENCEAYCKDRFPSLPPVRCVVVLRSIGTEKRFICLFLLLFPRFFIFVFASCERGRWSCCAVVLMIVYCIVLLC